MGQRKMGLCAWLSVCGFAALGVRRVVRGLWATQAETGCACSSEKENGEMRASSQVDKTSFDAERCGGGEAKAATEGGRGGRDGIAHACGHSAAEV